MRGLIFLFLLVWSSCAFGSDANLIEDIDFVARQNRIDGGDLTFVRSGIAIERDGSEVATGVMRTDSITIASPVEYTEIAEYRVLACDANYVYAAKSDATRELYRSGGAGYGWNHLKTFEASVSSIFVTSQGTLLVALYKGIERAGVIYRLNSDGTWHRVVGPDIFTIGAYVRDFGWAELDGRVFAGEYRIINQLENPGCVYMSEDDGQSWIKIHNPDDVEGRHLHTIVPCYVNGSFRVYIAYGDSNWAMFYLTEPSGSGGIWDATEVALNICLNPTGGFWVPEANSIIWGADGSQRPKGLIKQNLSDDSMSYLLRTEWRRRDSSNHNYNFLSVKQYEELYVAAGSGTSTDLHEHSGIWVSQDYIHWALAVRYQDDNLCVRGIGPDGNVWVSTLNRSIYFPAPKSLYVEGALIERGGSQGAGETPVVQGGGATKVVNDHGTDKWSGSVCSKWEPNDTVITSTQYLDLGESAIGDVMAGDLCIFSCWVKGSVGDGSGNNMGWDNRGRCRVLVRIRDKNVAESKDELFLNFWVGDDWQRIVLPVRATWTQGIPSDSRMRAIIYMQADANINAEFEILVDGVSYEKSICPAEWHDRETVRNADVLSYMPASFPAEFTDVFTVGSRFGDFDMGAASSGEGKSHIYLRTYADYVDNNVLAVVYDVTDRRIKLIDNPGVSQNLLAESSAMNFFRDEAITVGVTKVEQTATRLQVWVGGRYESINGSGGFDDNVDKLSKSYWGCDANSGQGGSLVFLRSRMWDEAKSEVDTKAEMEWPEISGGAPPDCNDWLETDLNNDCIVDYLDLSQITTNWLADDVPDIDLDDDGNVAMGDFAILANDWLRLAR